MTATIVHTRRDDLGRPVPIYKPNTPTPLATWLDPQAVATLIPDGPMVPERNGIAYAPWLDRPYSHVE